MWSQVQSKDSIKDSANIFINCHHVIIIITTSIIKSLRLGLAKFT